MSRALPVLTLLLALGAQTAHAQSSGGPAMSSAELAQTRGGFLTPDGFEVGFGAVVRTYVDGQLTLQTRFTLTDQGPVQQVEAGAYTPDLAAAATASGVKLGGETLKGVLVAGQGGATVVVHELSPERLANLTFNTASDRDIRQSTDITLNIPNLQGLQQDLSRQAMDLRLQQAVGMALRDAAR